MNREKILVAEDNVIHRALLRELLELRGYEVLAACNSADVLDRIVECNPSLVLLDIEMPGLDGFSVIHQLRSNPHYGNLFVVALTAYRCDREITLAAGFDECITKPVDGCSLDPVLENYEISMAARHNLGLAEDLLHIH